MSDWISEEVRRLPKQDGRVETGPTKFGDDWSGIFIRGDDCLSFSICLENALRENINIPFPDSTVLSNLLNLR